MQEWWTNLDWFSQVLWVTAIVGSIVLGILLLLNVLGGDADVGDVDADIEADGGVDFQFLSLKNIVAFFAVFGWTGISCYEAGMSKSVSTIIALVAGLAIMFVMASIFYGLSKMAYSGTLKMSNAVGHFGETYLTIPKNREGIGKVQIKVQGSLRELDAMCDDEQEIPTGTLIEVLKILNGNILLVKRANK